jgi:hypothetical protein
MNDRCMTWPLLTSERYSSYDCFPFNSSLAAKDAITSESYSVFSYQLLVSFNRLRVDLSDDSSPRDEPAVYHHRPNPVPFGVFRWVELARSNKKQKNERKKNANLVTIHSTLTEDAIVQFVSTKSGHFCILPTQSSSTNMVSLDETYSGSGL